MLNMRKHGYLLAEQTQKFDSHLLSICKNWLLFDWACVKIGYSLAEQSAKIISVHTFSQIKSFSSVPPVTCFSASFSRPLSNVLCSLSCVSVSCLSSCVPYFTNSVPCLPSYVPCLTSLVLVSRPLSPVLVSVLCLQSSVPCPTSLFLVSRHM